MAVCSNVIARTDAVIPSKARNLLFGADRNMEALYTIGYTKKSLADFIGRLQRAGVDCVVDIRLQNTSQLAGFAKRDDLEFLLTQGFGIAYVHMVELAPTEELLGDYKSKRDWDDYVERFAELIGERDMVSTFLQVVQQDSWRKPCLLCAEDSSEHCHRRLLAEAIKDRVEDLEVVHL